jgi:hypothetical protein
VESELRNVGLIESKEDPEWGAVVSPTVGESGGKVVVVAVNARSFEN